MKLYIKNMVCNRCKLVVRTEIEKAGLVPLSVELGEVEIKDEPTAAQRDSLYNSLHELGFEMIDNKKGRTIEKIKNAMIQLVHEAGDEDKKINLSSYISSRVNQDYNYLSNLFSEVEGTTIEKYFIALKIEKVKELLVYDELSLSEIAYRLGYSSVAYLSNQFKKVTGFTPSHFRSIRETKRRNIDEL
jgi:YesN/AraC family two-component response regulator